MENDYQHVNIGGFLVRTHEKRNKFIPTMFQVYSNDVSQVFNMGPKSNIH